MNLQARFGIGMALLLAGHSVAAFGQTSVVLREKATHQGNVLYLGDVADITSESRDGIERLLTTPLMPAPANGTREFISISRVRGLVIAQGIDVRQLNFEGAQQVEVSTMAGATTSRAPQPVAPLDREKVLESLHDALRTYLEDKTGHAEWEIEFQPDSKQLRELYPLCDELQVAAGEPPWTGRQTFDVSAVDSSEALRVSAVVRRCHHVVVMKRKVERGSLIGASDISLEIKKNQQPSNAFTLLSDAIGKEALRTLQPNAVLQSNAVRAPHLVRRGETITIFARTGGISVRTFAVAKQDGALGDLVQVETLEEKERFIARVSGRRQLEVLPSGASADDVAQANDLQRLKRQ